MNFKTIYKSAILAAMTAAVLTSCVKDDLYDTPHPESGTLTVSADWTDKGNGIDTPAKWNIAIGDYYGEETETAHKPDYMFEPGDYSLLAWNTAEGISVSGTTATATYSSGQLGWLFTHTQPITIARDRDHIFTASMHQQVHLLTIMLDIEGDAADRITGIDADLTGVASSLDFARNEHGDPVAVGMTFRKSEQSGARSGGVARWVATKRLLGVAGASQQFSAVIRFADGNPQAVTVNSDLTADLKDFNSGKTIPVTLDGKLVVVPTQSGVTATIQKWESLDDWNVDAF